MNPFYFLLPAFVRLYLAAYGPFGTLAAGGNTPSKPPAAGPSFISKSNNHPVLPTANLVAPGFALPAVTASEHLIIHHNRKHIKRFLRFCLCCLLLAESYAVQAQTIYIIPNRTSNPNDSSWDNTAPGSQLQSKINSAASGTQLWVAKSTYQLAANASFTIKEGVKIYGNSGVGAGHIQQSLLLSGQVLATALQ